MCTGDWHVVTLDDHHLRASGLLVFTDAGTALVWADSGAGNLVLGLARLQGATSASGP
jgi:hypothetical protein